MPETFYETLKRDRLFKDATKDLKLQKRDFQLIAIVSSAAERLLGEAKVKIAKQEGELETERIRTKAALLLGLNRQSLKTGFIALFTPIDDIPKLDWSGKGGEQISENSDLEGKKKSVVTVVRDKTQLEQERAAEEEALKLLPVYARWPTLVVKRTIARMSPVTIAAWAVILISAAIVYAERSIASVEKTYNTAIEQRDRYQVDLETKGQKITMLEDQVASIPGLNAQRAELEEQVVALNQQLAEKSSQIEKERSQADEERKNLIDAHEQRIDEFSKNSTEAMQKMVETVQAANTRLTDDNKSLNRSIKDLELQLQAANSKSGDSATRLSTMNLELDQLRQDLRDERRRASEIQSQLSQYESLVPFVQDLTRSIDHFFYRKANLQLYQRRDCFREEYRNLYLGARKVLDANSIRSDMQFASGQALSYVVEQCRKELR